MAEEADALSTIQVLLSGNWVAANAQNVTPNFFLSGEQPVGRLDYNFTKAAILIYLPSHTTVPNGLGPSHREATTDRVSIDIRTTSSRSLARDCYNECRRIFSDKINNPDSSFQQLLPDVGFQDFSTPRFYRYVYDIHLRSWTVER